jgi:hypothetical protein
MDTHAISAHEKSLSTQFLRMRNFVAGRPRSDNEWNLGADFGEQKTFFSAPAAPRCFCLALNI